MVKNADRTHFFTGPVRRLAFSDKRPRTVPHSCRAPLASTIRKGGLSKSPLRKTLERQKQRCQLSSLHTPNYSPLPLIQICEGLDSLKLCEWDTKEFLASTTGRENFQPSLGFCLFVFILHIANQLRILAGFYLEEGTSVWTLAHSPTFISQWLC